MPLVRIQSDNDLLSRLDRQWSAECEGFGEALDDYAAPHLQHARKICGETPPDPSYGVFALDDGADIQALMHVNRARLPRSDGHTLRVLWVLLAPRFDYAEVSAPEFARIAAGIISGAIDVSETEMPSKQIKIHLNGIGDRRFFHGMASALAGAKFNVEVKASWLHISPA